MPCEICGKEGKLVEAKIEGTVLEVCEDCAELGEVLERGQVQPKQRKRKRNLPQQPEEILINNFGSAVKAAREEKEMEIAKVAEEVKEKESVIHRIENERLKPDKDLARKLETFLNIDLYVNEENSPATSTKSQDKQGVTLGDVAEVKRQKSD